MTNTKLARLLGVSRSTVGRWANGDRVPTPKHFYAIYDLLLARADRLACDEEWTKLQLGEHDRTRWIQVFNHALAHGRWYEGTGP